MSEPTEPAATHPKLDENGIDRTLIRACLKETSLECLQALEEMHQLAEGAKRGSEPVSPAD